MTTISSYNMNMPPSPRAMMDSRIGAAVETGALSEVDGDALETALDSIDSSLSSSASQDQSRLDPSAMKDRIDSLIDEQVSAGSLTQDQAAALQSFFAQGAPNDVQASADGESGMSVDGLSGAGAMDGPRGMRGPPPPPPAADEDSDNNVSDTTSTSATDQLDSIIAFLENLRSSLSQSLYSATASNAANSNSSGLVVDSLA